MKKYFKDIDIKTKTDIVMNIKDLREIFEENLYEQNMDLQAEEGDLMFGKEWHKYIDYHDNYNSFFLRLNNWKQFIDNLDSDYLCKEGLDLYNVIMRLYNEWENIVLDTVENEDKYDLLEEELEEKCKELLNICEDQLHKYEDFPTEEDLRYYVIDAVQNDIYDNYYIIDNDTSKVYEDISYTKTFE